MARRSNMKVARVTPEELLVELADNNPPPEEKWFQRDDFEPTYGATELRQAAKNGWIELDATGEPEVWRFRLTPLGRAVLAGDAG